MRVDRNAVDRSRGWILTLKFGSAGAFRIAENGAVVYFADRDDAADEKTRTTLGEG